MSTLVVAATLAGCAADPVAEQPVSQDSDRYRTQLIDQLDLRLPMFANWEVTDAERRPDAAARYEGLSAAQPAACGLDGAATKAAHTATYGGSDWTGAHGVGPEGQLFDVSILFGNKGTRSDVSSFVEKCASTEFMVEGGTATVEVAVAPEFADDAFEDVYGYTSKTTERRGQEVAARSSILVVGKSNSLTLVLTFSNSGDLQTHYAEAVWEAAAQRLERAR
ncbi:hypothetical protein [Antrihabitans sp. YC2-6]|uniref:hypothetical protein n=1 Tax=Antrihabitans sp. YC2-6 TaxID=2799498 RepID=UPI0018F48BA2|nr:hypothetical protein [Antrihabitans sp. YC2-6]MBJ8347457.1 hypothetical protein [Antrihabitans sp. YC2-6]